MVDRTHGDFAIIQTGLAIGEEVGREDAARALSNLAFNADNHSRWPSPRRRARWRRWWRCGAQWGSAVGKENAVGTLKSLLSTGSQRSRTPSSIWAAP
jgi:hypothetical protein